VKTVLKLELFNSPDETNYRVNNYFGHLRQTSWFALRFSGKTKLQQKFSVIPQAFFLYKQNSTTCATATIIRQTQHGIDSNIRNMYHENNVPKNEF